MQSVDLHQKAEADSIEIGRRVLQAESNALSRTADRLGRAFADTVELVQGASGKVVISALGKSGHVGRKIAATLCSTGTPAVFLHASEALHGDLGVYAPGDPTILISKSGSTGELVQMIPILREFGSKIIALVGRIDSPLANSADLVLDGSVDQEADNLNLAPTSSSTVALGIGDALAVALMDSNGFTGADFARFHPGGALGGQLTTRVEALMSRSYPHVRPGASLRTAIIEMSRFPVGATLVTGDDGRLEGIVTDGDIRRALQQVVEIDQMTIADVMTADPVTVEPTAFMSEAVHKMEERPSQISVLPVVPAGSRAAIGIIRIHDAYQSLQG